MPSLPAVMNELMSYTETPTLVAPLLDSVSPAPQAVRPIAIAAAETTAVILDASLIVFSLSLWDVRIRIEQSGHARLRVDQTSTATAATMRTPLMTSCQ